MYNVEQFYVIAINTLFLARFYQSEHRKVDGEMIYAISTDKKKQEIYNSWEDYPQKQLYSFLAK